MDRGAQTEVGDAAHCRHRIGLSGQQPELGADLLAAGVAEGPEIGRALRAALAARLDGRVSDRDGELNEALKAVRASQSRSPD